jgi:hypothetical protein
MPVIKQLPPIDLSIGCYVGAQAMAGFGVRPLAAGPIITSSKESVYIKSFFVGFFSPEYYRGVNNESTLSLEIFLSDFKHHNLSILKLLILFQIHKSSVKLTSRPGRCRRVVKKIKTKSKCKQTPGGTFSVKSTHATS